MRLVLSIYLFIACCSSIYLKTWILLPKSNKSAQNRPYLSLQILPNCSHQKSSTPYIFQYFRFEIKKTEANNYLAKLVKKPYSKFEEEILKNLGCETFLVTAIYGPKDL